MAAGLRSAIFVASYRSGEAVLRHRVDQLLEFYAPLGIEGVNLIRIPRMSLLAGELCFGPPAVGGCRTPPAPAWVNADDAWLLWGGPPPGWLAADRLLAADDRALRTLDQTIAAFVAKDGRARLVSGCAGAAALFRASSDEISAWSTHAVAAGHLAHAAVDIDPETLPEFFAAEFVGAGRTHLRGVEAVPAATEIAFTPRGASARSYWPPRERFAPVPERSAAAAAEAALLETLQRRVSPATDIELGLTAGADSRVTAVALQALGVPFRAVTIAPGMDGPDAAGAARVAQNLGVSHRIYGYRLTGDQDSVALIDAESRWSEGLAPLNGLGMADGGSPSVFVTGNGGETARAWYYRWQALNYRHPGPNELRRVLGHLHRRIRGADPDAHAQLDRAVSAWIALAQQTGHSGWRTLDVVYENERMHRWGRTRLPRARAPVLYAFSSPDLTRTLVSLPLAERVRDAFHRRFLAKYAPALNVGPPPGQRRGVPRPIRRAISASRERRGLGQASSSPWFWTEVWEDRPVNRTFIADEALSSDLLRGALGAGWLERVRTGFVAGEDHATQVAFLAVGIAALDRALEGLRR